MNQDLKYIQSSLLNFRKAFTIVIVINLIFLLERSILDFMGFMYGMIIADIFYLLFLIIGLFGAYQYRVNYVAASTIFSLVWIAWNLFVVCNYLNVGLLDKYNPVALNLNTNMKSWWFTSSIGCTEHIENRLEQYKFEQGFERIKTFIDPTSSTKSTTTSKLTTLLSSDVTNQIRSTDSLNPVNQVNFSTRKMTKNAVLENIIRKNCFLPFYTIEIIHSGVLIFLGVLCVIFGLLLANAFNDDDEDINFIGGFDSTEIEKENEKNVNINVIQQQQQQPQVIPIIPRNGQIIIEPLYTQKLQ